MSRITTHILDAVLGRPAAAVAVRLEQLHDSVWAPVSNSLTDSDGRCPNLAPDAPAGTYRLTFSTGDYLAQKSRQTIYPEISIPFTCNGQDHYHLPLLLSDNSYTTYRGS